MSTEFKPPPLRAAISTTHALSSLDILSTVLNIADISVLIGAAYAMHWIRFQTFSMPHVFILCIACTLLVFIVLSQTLSLYDTKQLGQLLHQLMSLSVALMLTLLCLLALLFFAHSGAIFSRIWIVGWFVLSVLGMTYARLRLARHIVYLKNTGLLRRNIIMIGSEPSCIALAEKLRKNCASLHIAGFFLLSENSCNEHAVKEHASSEIPLMHTLSDLLHYCHTHVIDDVMVTPEVEHHPLRDELLEKLEVLPCNINYCLPNSFLHHPASCIELVSNVPVITVLKAPLQGKNFLLKRLEDIVVASVALIILSPILLVISLCIKLEDGGPILYLQTRNGFAGKPFTIYKFRSMKPHIPAEGSVVQATRNDERLTWVGKYIRLTSIDELPQLFNVLKGDMSVVGPRPHAIEHNDHYAGYINGYATRHRIKPGMTGWAQVNGFRGETETLEKMHQRVQHDLYYIDNWSILFDLKIITLTPLAVLTRRNAY